MRQGRCRCVAVPQPAARFVVVEVKALEMPALPLEDRLGGDGAQSHPRAASEGMLRSCAV